MRTGPACSACGADTVPILYGYPSVAMLEAAGEGDFVIGGCVIEDDPPQWHCRGCGAKWRAADLPVDAAVLDRAEGALLGVHAGDSLGATVEFLDRAEIEARFPGGHREIVGGGPCGWAAGDPTDDTDLTWAVARAYLGSGDAVDAAAEHMLDWYRSGPRDVGGTTASALQRVADGVAPYESGETGEGSQANGSLMRTMPVAVAHLYDADLRATYAAAMSGITHAHPVCVDACVAYCDVAAALIRGTGPDEAVRAVLRPTRHPEVAAAVADALRARSPDDLDGPRGGYVLWSLRLALWAVRQETSFEEGVVGVVACGGDTDTNGAIAGGLLGARWGASAIPRRWLDVLKLADDLRHFVTVVSSRWP